MLLCRVPPPTPPPPAPATSPGPPGTAPQSNRVNPFVSSSVPHPPRTGSAGTGTFPCLRCPLPFHICPHTPVFPFHLQLLKTLFQIIIITVTIITIIIITIEYLISNIFIPDILRKMRVSYQLLGRTTWPFLEHKRRGKAVGSTGPARSVLALSPTPASSAPPREALPGARRAGPPAAAHPPPAPARPGPARPGGAAAVLRGVNLSRRALQKRELGNLSLI